MTTSPAAQSDPQNTTARKVRVMVVDDSAVVRGLVSRWVDEDLEMETCGRFSNGHLAIEGVARSAPDVIVLDIEMPVMDGLTALPELLKRMPGVKVIIASTLSRRNAEISLKALSLGATDYIPKPETNRGVTTSLEFRNELLRKIKAVAPVGTGSPLGTPSARSEPFAQRTASGVQPAQKQTFTLRAPSSIAPRILAIGSSTGGPQALAQVMEDIGPVVGNVPIVITQHMPPTFTAILAERLGRAANRPAKEGEDGETVLAGHIYVAPGGKHMGLRERDGAVVVHVYDGPLINYCKPAVDPLFESVSRIFGPATLAIVLTGMGHDGAAGGKVIANAGGTVIAQDQATSVVWGMPGATAAEGACAAVLPLKEIGPKTRSLLQRGNK